MTENATSLDNKPNGRNRGQSGPVATEILTNSNVAELLRINAISLTLQRLAIAQVLLTRPVHLTADQVLTLSRETIPEISRATVYNTLNLLQKKGLIGELNVASGRVVYDSNIKPHFHIYNVDTGEMSDILEGELKVSGAPNLPNGVVLDSIDLIVRVRSTDS
jgi:Fur family iron response transcriptional regulator